MIPDKIIFDPPVVIPSPTDASRKVRICEIDFGRFQFHIDEHQQIVVACSPHFSITRICGRGAHAPFIPNWTRDELRAAFLKQVGLPLSAEEISA